MSDEQMSKFPALQVANHYRYIHCRDCSYCTGCHRDRYTLKGLFLVYSGTLFTVQVAKLYRTLQGFSYCTGCQPLKISKNCRYCYLLYTEQVANFKIYSLYSMYNMEKCIFSYIFNMECCIHMYIRVLCKIVYSLCTCLYKTEYFACICII